MSITKEKNSESIKKGADIECLLSYNDLNIDNFVQIISKLNELEFSFKEKEPFYVEKSDLFVTDSIQTISSLNQLIELIKGKKINSVVVSLNGELFDVETEFSIEFNFQYKVIVISVIEDMLWAFSNKKEDIRFERLKAFAAICETTCNLLEPLFVIIDTEDIYPEEFTVEKATAFGKKVKYKYDSFSDENLMKFYKWFNNEYQKRWD